MIHRMLKQGEEIKRGDEHYSDGWRPTVDVGCMINRSDVGFYRRPIEDTCIPSFRHMYSANGVTITVDETADIKQAAAFLGAIAMMLDGQAES